MYNSPVRNAKGWVTRLAVSVCCSFFAGFSAVAADLTDQFIVTQQGFKPTEKHPAAFIGYKNATTGVGDEIFDDLKSVAEKTHSPLIVIWSNAGCQYCDNLVEAINREDGIGGRYFSIWLSRMALTYNCYFGYFKGAGDPSKGTLTPAACKQAYDFCYNPDSYYPWPLYACYWVHPDGSVHKECGSLTAGVSVQYLQGVVQRFLNANAPTTKPPHEEGEVAVPGDATFACGNTEKARLEAMPSTAQVYVPVIKTLNLNVETTNQVVVIGIPAPDATNAAVAVTNEIVWTAETNATSLVQEIPVPKSFWTSNTNWTGTAAITVELRGTNGVLNAKTSITLVEERENSALFPKWIGEDFGFGEWTLDFDAATNKVFAFNTNDMEAYTLVMVGGGLWCPDCIQCEAGLVGKPEFTAWAKSNNVALVVSDQPVFETTAASLVTHDFVTDGASGSYYLSSKGLRTADGAAQFNAMTNRSYNLWKKNPSAARVANPTFILFRTDGTIAGRLQESRIEDPRVADNNEPYTLEENLARLDDLLKMAKDSSADGMSEESNDNLETTPLEIAYEGAEDAISLQVNDTVDYVRVTSLPTNTYFDIEINDIPDVFSNACFKAELLAWNGADYVPVTAEKPNTWKLTADQAATNAFVKFSAYGDGRYAIFGSNTVIDVSFRFLEMQPDAGAIALTDGGTKLVEGQKTNITISVNRSIWHSGTVTGLLELVEAETTAQRYRFAWPTNDAGDYVAVPLVWEDGETGVRGFNLPLINDPVWDGDEKIVVKLTGYGDYEVELDEAASRWELTIVEDDMKEPGKIGFAPEKSEPSATKQNIVFARENTTIKLAVERVSGSHGEAAVTLGATSGNLSDGRLTWGSKDMEAVKYAEFVVPSLKQGQSQTTVYVTLKKDGEVPLVTTATRLQIRVLPDDAPVFVSDKEECTGVQSEKMEKIIKLNSELPAGAVVTLSRTSGSVPPGVTVRYDKTLNAIVISGIPSGFGDFTAVYQVIVRSSGKMMYSMPVTVDFNLSPRAEAMPLLAKACTFQDLPVIDTGESRLTGLLDVTLPVSGRLSAKYRKANGKTVAMTANGWNSIADGSASAELTSSSGYKLSFTFSDNGSIRAEVTDPDYGGTALMVIRPASEPWSVSNKATAYKGVYTLEIAPTNAVSGEPLCMGAAGLSFRLNTESAYRTGRMIFSGTLPNGKSVNGAGTLLPLGDDVAALPVFSPSTTDALAGLVNVDADLVNTCTNGNLKAIRLNPDVRMIWSHAEPRLPADYSYETECSAWGAYLPTGLDWGARWQRDFLTSDLWFSVEGLTNRTCLVASKSGVKINTSKSVTNTLQMTFSFTPSTGIARGTLRYDNRTLNWSGVFLSDWHECGSCGTPVETTRPLLLGNAWTTVLDEYTDDKGRKLRASVREGCEVRIDTKENLDAAKPVND